MKSIMLKLSGLACLFIISTASHGYIIPTEQELRLLPPYCKKTAVISKHYGNEQAPTGHDYETKQFIQVYGHNFWHMHHYCFGLMHLNRAYGAKNQGEKGGNLGQAIKEFDYVLNAAEKDFPLLPEIHTNKGTVLMLQKKEGAAVAEFRKAIALKPNYPQPYGQLSDYYEEIRKADMALQILEQGLTHNPDAKSLQRRYTRLGGKKVFTAQPDPASISPAPQQKEPVGQEVVQSIPAKPVAAEPRLPEPARLPAASQQADKPNSYCRFCP